MRTSSSGAPQKPAIKASFHRRSRQPHNRQTFHSSHPPTRRGRWPTGTTIGKTGPTRSNIIRKRSRAALTIPMGTDLGNCFRFLGQPQKALEQYELAQKKTRWTRTVFSIRPASLPKCCTMISALYQSRENSCAISAKPAGGVGETVGSPNSGKDEKRQMIHFAKSRANVT